MSGTWVDRIGRIGEAILRWSLVLFFVGFGLLKFTADEATAVEPLMRHSPFLFWAPALFGRQGASDLIGVIEIAMGTGIALRRLRPRWSGYASLATAGALVVTLSFLATTPNLGAFSGFLAKDLTLLGAALWAASEAFRASRQRA